MNRKIVGRTIGLILLIELLCMLPALLLSAFDGDAADVRAFCLTILIGLAAAGLLLAACRQAGDDFLAQDGFLTVALAWLVISVCGALPFFLSGQIPNFIDALFETISGFTTTGASILPDVEALGRGLLYWRSFTHWLGGMGVLVFVLAIVPADKNAGGMLHLMRAESPGPSVGKLTPRLHKTASILYGIYIALTALCVLFLVAGGMPFLESLCTAFGTAGTGGFGIKNDSMISYSPYLQNVCTVFMLLFGVNFSIFYLALLGRIRDVLHDEELRAYLAIFAAATALIAWDIRPMLSSWGESLHHAAFQVSSIMTTTGFCTIDFNLWPSFSKSILLVLMILGACAGSTGGGLKTIRAVLLLKDTRRNIGQLLRPRHVRVIHLNGRPVGEQVIRGLGAYLAAYLTITFVSFILISLDEFSIETNLSAVFSCFNNIGPGLDEVGPLSNYSCFSNFSTLILSADMLLGRLEIFPMLAIFSPLSWNKRR